MKELRVTMGNNINSKTYRIKNNSNESGIIKKHTRFLTRYSLCVTEGNKCHCIKNEVLH